MNNDHVTLQQTGRQDEPAMNTDLPERLRAAADEMATGYVLPGTRTLILDVAQELDDLTRYLALARADKHRLEAALAIATAGEARLCTNLVQRTEERDDARRQLAAKETA